MAFHGKAVPIRLPFVEHLNKDTFIYNTVKPLQFVQNNGEKNQYLEILLFGCLTVVQTYAYTYMISNIEYS